MQTRWCCKDGVAIATSSSTPLSTLLARLSSSLADFFIFFTYRWFCGFTSCLVSELQAQVLGGRNPFTSAFGSFSGADDPRPARHSCCVGTRNFPTGALLRAAVLLWPRRREPGQRPGLLVPRVKSWLSVCHERRKLRLK